MFSAEILEEIRDVLADIRLLCACVPENREGFVFDFVEIYRNSAGRLPGI
jgi:hypothetical protein